jgi:hypothetical protein
MVFDWAVLRIMGQKEWKEEKDEENYTMKSFVTCSAGQILLGWFKRRKMRGMCRVSCTEETTNV